MKKEDINYILNVLREATIQWEGRRECLVEGRKKVKIGKFKNGNDSYLYKYQCSHCKKWFKEPKIEIDHITEVGEKPKVLEDAIPWIERLYDRKNLQKLCIQCHSIKTSKFNATLRYKRKTENLL